MISEPNTDREVWYSWKSLCLQNGDEVLTCFHFNVFPEGGSRLHLGCFSFLICASSFPFLRLSSTPCRARGKERRTEESNKSFFIYIHWNTWVSLHSSANRICPYDVEVWLFNKFIIIIKIGYTVEICEMCGLYKLQRQ